MPSTAGPAVLARAQTLNALLMAPIGVLPAALGDPLRPFQVGLGPEILARRRPEVAVNVCERAIRNYVRSFSYRHAVAQPGSMRYDLDGNPVEPVSEKDRHDMQRNCEVDQERARQRKAAAALAAAAAGAEAGGPTEEAAPSGSQGG
ncbi:ProQ/FINO family protein [Methylobacterium tarhaniae]|uniref:ProQ/FINO family protein n=1 Tax=Methylobacterium tarhaniae TaxID=1187852 RepID=UPI00069D9864|nr:ProQ/FINO family protein [Methylobacterium tarhaniae]